MRELKFRAWDKINHRMREVIQINFTNQYVWVKTNTIPYALSSQQYEIMQYTSLKDRNGKEIYEGDILEYRWLLDTTDIISRGIIINRNDSMGFTASGFSCQLPNTVSFLTYETWDSKCKVIGNIYENPELLKV